MPFKSASYLLPRSSDAPFQKVLLLFAIKLIMEFWNTTPGVLVLTYLCIASAVSFIPQLFRILARRDSSGVAIAYVLLNLVSATHQLALGALYFGFADVQDNVFVWSWPPSTTDWLNVAQLLIFWAGTLAIFMACLATSTQSAGAKSVAVLIYLAVLLVTIVPAVVIINDPEEHKKSPGRWPPFLARDLFLGGHVLYIVPVVTLLAAVSFYFEASVILLRPPGDAGSLSLIGMLVQALVFGAVAVSWESRVRWPDHPPPLGGGLVWWGWYRMIGWAAIDNAIFAAGQAYLWFLLRRRVTANVALTGETEPLVG
ncbi:hypothetical protein N0V82_010405 [Gnomoniopsis sp. IMI 355080]|nr:hypothetical protein N0V82_010405 [Gnomoniopsis sp. IMI 355080]